MNPTSFGKQHGIMLMKYAGISFISGAVNHGFFSGSRSLWTAAIGIVLFVTGAWLEHRASEEEHPQGLFQSLFMGTLLSIGLGFFTGGLQHFPDSPVRSAWVVPLGFFISVIALVSTLQLRWQRALWAWAPPSALCAGLAIKPLSDIQNGLQVATRMVTLPVQPMTITTIMHRTAHPRLLYKPCRSAAASRSRC